MILLSLFTNTPTVQRFYSWQGPIGLYHCARSGHGHRKEDGAHTAGEAETNILNVLLDHLRDSPNTHVNTLQCYTLYMLYVMLYVMHYVTHYGVHDSNLRTPTHPLHTSYCIYQHWHTRDIHTLCHTSCVTMTTMTHMTFPLWRYMTTPSILSYNPSYMNPSYDDTHDLPSMTHTHTHTHTITITTAITNNNNNTKRYVYQ